jgi:hypothetical protein
MEGHVVDNPDHKAAAAFWDRWQDLGSIALLLVLTMGLRGWLLAHTEVPARDSIGFIRYALEFESQPWDSVLRNNHQHPAYPLTILAVSWPVRALWNGPDPQSTDLSAEAEAMSLSARLASNLAAVLLVIPMFYLGKSLFHRAAGIGGAALLQCLPVSAHILSDGLSEALFLLFASSALALAVLAMQTRRPGHFALCGLFCGLSYQTRPEGALLLAAAGLVLLILPRLSGQRLAFKQWAACAGSLLVCAVIVGSPYVLATGHLTNKPSVDFLFGEKVPELENAPRVQDADRTAPALASMFAFVLDLKQSVLNRALTALWKLAGELAKCFHYVAWVPVLLGVWWFRGRARIVPGIMVLLVLCGLWVMGLCWLAVKVGYLSDRHLMLLLMCGCITAAAAIWELPSRLSAWLLRQPWRGVAGGPLPPSAISAAVAAILLGGILASGFPKTLEGLHSNRAGYHAAGLWLADHSQPADQIVDDHCWAHYYAGCVFREGKPIPPVVGYQPMRYFVVGRRDKEIKENFEPWNKPAPIREEDVQANGGQVVWSWPEPANSKDAAVVIYVIRPRQ